MEIKYSKYSPTGNITLLADPPADAGAREAVISALLAREPDAEQVGFILPAPHADAKLEMAGGEFCGNASLSLAVHLLKNSGRREAQYTFEVSGCNMPIRCRVKAENGFFSGSVSMPLPRQTGEKEFKLDGKKYLLPFAELPGITHIILPEEKFGSDCRELMERAVKKWRRELGAKALGLMLLDEKTPRMTPLVYVAETGSLCWEHGCGSGSTAAAVYLAERGGVNSAFDLVQPGGSINVSVTLRNGWASDISMKENVFALTEDVLCVEGSGGLEQKSL